MRNYGYKVLGVIEKIDRATSPSAVVDELQDALRDLGAEFFAVHFVPHKDEKIEDLILHWRAPDDWKTAYTDKYQFYDPAMKHTKTTALPYEWIDTPIPEGVRHEDKIIEMRKVAVDCNVDKGIVVPVLGTDGAVGAVWAGGPTFNERKRFAPVLHTIGHYAFLRARKLVGGRRLTRARLSGREKDILSWIYRGKTAWEIGAILGISQRTVEWHTQRLLRKLDAPNRMQAVLLAISDRLIVPLLVGLATALEVYYVVIDPLMLDI